MILRQLIPKTTKLRRRINTRYYSKNISYETWKSDLPEIKYKNFLRAIEKDNFNQANKLFKELSETNYGSPWTYVSMIKYLREKKKYKEALKVYDEAEKNLEEPSIPLIVQLITLLLESNQISECEDLIEILENDTNLKKNSYYYSSIIRLYCGVGNGEAALVAYRNITGNKNIAIECLLRYCQRFRFLPQSSEIIDLIIDEMSENEYDERAYSQLLRGVKVDTNILKLLKECDIKMTPALFNRLSRECLPQNDITLSMKIYNTCHQLGIKPPSGMINEMVSVLNKVSDLETRSKIVQIFDLMKIERKKHNYEPKLFIIRAMTGIFATHPWNNIKEEEYMKYIKLTNVNDSILDEWFDQMSIWVDQFCKTNNIDSKYDYTISLLSE